jgi:mono/diheme cytochrome c family protein
VTIPLTASAWLNPFLDALQTTQQLLGDAAHALGVVRDSHGQAAWPWTRRIATETLLIDLGVARQLAEAFLVTGGALLLALLALVWRQARIPLAIAAGLAAWCAPWPDTGLWLTDAVPTSFQDTPFSVSSIAHGAPLYAQHCAACHGADGRGEGPLAATLVRWPPTVVGPLLGHRLDGEMFWRVLHGMHDTHGVETMPGFAGRLSDADAWAVLDYMKLLAAGGAARSGEGWPVPVVLPALEVRCGDAAAQPLARWRSAQRVRVVALGDGATPPREDPRWQTLLLTRDDVAPKETTRAAWAQNDRATCFASTPGAWSAFAGIAGVSPHDFADVELLADRDGWLRAETRPGGGGWANATLLCSVSGTPSKIGGAARGGDDISGLLARIDAEPVRYVKGGFVH